MNKQYTMYIVHLRKSRKVTVVCDDGLLSGKNNSIKFLSGAIESNNGNTKILCLNMNTQQEGVLEILSEQPVTEMIDFCIDRNKKRELRYGDFYYAEFDYCEV